MKAINRLKQVFNRPQISGRTQGPKYAAVSVMVLSLFLTDPFRENSVVMAQQGRKSDPAAGKPSQDKAGNAKTNTGKAAPVKPGAEKPGAEKPGAEKPAAVKPAPGKPASGKPAPQKTQPTTTKPPQASSADAATVEAATQVLDLRTLPMPEGAELFGGRQPGSLSYQIKSEPKSPFEFHQQQLTSAGWTEKPGTMSEAAYASGMFSKAGFTISVSTSLTGQPGQEMVSHVSIMNFGNISVATLPVLKGASSTFASEATAIYSTDAAVAEAFEQTKKLLVAAGWELYGSNDLSADSKLFAVKRNAIQISVMVSLAPAQGNKTSIMYSSMLLAADIPAPETATQLSFNGTEKKLYFESAQDYNQVAEFYLKTLTARGWKSTTDTAMTSLDEFKRPVAMLVFRNASEDLIMLNMDKREETTVADVRHQTKQEFEESEARAKEAAEQLIAEREKQKAEQEMEDEPAEDDVDIDALANAAIAEALKGINKKPSKGGRSVKPSKDAVNVLVPKGVKVNQTGKNVLQIKVKAGEGLKTAAFLSGHLKADGWESEEDDSEMDETSGNLSFVRAQQSLTLTYVDTGFADVMMMVIGIGADLAASETDAPAKSTSASKPNGKPAAADADEADEEMEEEPEVSDIEMADKEEADDEEKPVDPVRVERPKKGIAKLSPLPNQGTAGMGDKKFELNQMIAYEVISQNEWRTRIVASSKPVKQEKLLALLKADGTDEDMEFPEPNVRIEIDQDGEVASVSYALDGVSGGGNSGIVGEVLVEDGRARGTLKPEKEGEFFERTYTWDVSFDTPVLTRESTPAKPKLDLPKLENTGELTLGKMKWKLTHVVAYETKVFDEIVTKVFVSEKSIDMKKLKDSLAADGTDNGLFEFHPQVVLQISDIDQIEQYAIWADNASISSNENLDGDATVSDERVRGIATLSEPGEFSDAKYQFKVSFDVELIRLPAGPK